MGRRGSASWLGPRGHPMPSPPAPWFLVGGQQPAPLRPGFAARSSYLWDDERDHRPGRLAQGWGAACLFGDLTCGPHRTCLPPAIQSPCSPRVAQCLLLLRGAAAEVPER